MLDRVAPALGFSCAGRTKAIVADADGRSGDDFDKVAGGAGDDKPYGWIVPVEPGGGPPVEQDPDDDMVGGALDGGAGTDLCRKGTQVNCES
jgi:hypothetical protein